MDAQNASRRFLTLTKVDPAKRESGKFTHLHGDATDFGS
jgi:hypothetical protein